eukprot:m.89866 g.89866  ORF g.89866 m.89866 type:complete len:71 (-) comp14868_c3_seq16:227-439(-)
MHDVLARLHETMSAEEFGNSEKDDYSATFSYTSQAKVVVHVTTDADLQSYREFALHRRDAYKLQVRGTSI